MGNKPRLINIDKDAVRPASARPPRSISHPSSFTTTMHIDRGLPMGKDTSAMMTENHSVGFCRQRHAPGVRTIERWAGR